jgi:hypothetical protein
VECPGYRDLTTLAFRNETEEIARKAKRRHVRDLPPSKMERSSGRGSLGQMPTERDINILLTISARTAAFAAYTQPG